MINKVSSNKSAYLKLAMMLSLTLATQLITILKSSRVAALFGTSVEMDAYNFINSIAGFVFSFMGSGIATVLIPAMSRKDKSPKVMNGFLTVLYGFSLLLLAIFVVLCRSILEGIGVYSQEFIDIASSLAVVILLGQFMNTINSVSTAYLQCENSFNLPKFMALCATAAITLIVYLHKDLNIYQYAFYTFILLFAEMAVQYLYAKKRGFRYRPALPLKDPELKQMFRIFLPTVWGSGVYQITLMTDSFLSSGMGTGNLSILSYSNTISGMINTVIAGNIMLYLYPKIAVEADSVQGKRKLFQYMNFFAALMCVVVLLFVAAGYDAVRILFERGAFTSDATMGVFVCVLIYLLGAPVNVMRDVVYRFFYAKGNTKSTFYNGLFASILNVIISITLVPFIGLYGIVLGTTLTAVFSFTSILIRMKKQYSFDDNFKLFVIEMVKLVCAALLAAFACMVVKYCLMKWNSIVVSVVSAVVVVAVFGGSLLIMKSNFYKVELE